MVAEVDTYIITKKLPHMSIQLYFNLFCIIKLLFISHYTINIQMWQAELSPYQRLVKVCYTHGAHLFWLQNVLLNFDCISWCCVNKAWPFVSVTTRGCCWLFYVPCKQRCTLPCTGHILYTSQCKWHCFILSVMWKSISRRLYV